VIEAGATTVKKSSAIFLSYSSGDADAARRICEALREAGLEVWFDQSELRSGDAWDASIRRQIKECALSVQNDLEQWFDPDSVQHLIEGLRKAGMNK